MGRSKKTNIPFLIVLVFTIFFICSFQSGFLKVEVASAQNIDFFLNPRPSLNSLIFSPTTLFWNNIQNQIQNLLNNNWGGEGEKEGPFVRIRVVEKKSGTPFLLPSLSINATPEYISYGNSSRITWESSNADTCEAFKGWSGRKPLSGFQIVSPKETTTYLIQCTNDNGSKLEEITVAVTEKDGGVVPIFDDPPAVPVLISPVNGSTDFSPSRPLVWNKPERATYYQLQISKNLSFTNLVFSSGEIKATSINVAEYLSENQIYYWRVRAINNVGSSSWSNVHSFTTSKDGVDHSNFLFYESFDKEISSSSWYRHGRMPYSINIVKSPRRAGDGAIRFESHRTDPLIYGSPRSQIVLLEPRDGNTFHDSYGVEYWYGLSLLLPEDWEIDVTENPEILVQWHGAANLGRTPVVSINERQGSYILLIDWNPTENQMITERKTFDLGPISPGNWEDWVFNIVWSTGNDGVVKLWRNGNLVVEHFGPNCYNDPQGPYFMLGIYKWIWKYPPYPQDQGGSSLEKRVVYYDELRIGGPDSSYNDVVPRSEDGPIGPPIGPTLPHTPNLSSPSNNASSISTSPFFAWKKSSGAQKYHLQISRDSNFSNLLYNQSNIISDSRQVSGLANNQTYYWRVRAGNNAGYSNWSSVWSFKTIESQVAGSFFHPMTVTTPQEVEIVKDRIRKNIEPQATAFGELIKDANVALGFKPNPPAVMNHIGDSGDSSGSNDYITSEFREALRRESVQAYAAALAYLYTDETRYAEKAREILNAWANKDTQFIGHTHRGIHLGSFFHDMLYAADLIHHYSGWTSNERAKFESWWRNRALEGTGNIRWNVYNKRNNHKDHGLLGMITTAITFEDAELLEEAVGILRTYFDGDWKIMKDERGTFMTWEVTRNEGYSGLSYTAYSFTSLAQILEMARHAGYNLWHEKTNTGPNPLSEAYEDLMRRRTKTTGPPKGGATLKDAIEQYFLWNELKQPYPWNSAPFIMTGRRNMYEIANNHYDFDFGISNWIRSVRPVFGEQGDKYVTLNKGNMPVSSGPIGPSIPTIPNLSSPSNNANNISTSPTLVWNSVEGAKTYHLQVSTNSNFSSFIYNQSNITSNSRQLSDLANNQIYYWRVKAINDAGEGSWSSVWTFTTTPKPTVSGDRIQPYSANPYYWQYKGEPILLLGAGRDHNMFNFSTSPDSYLNALVANGGNYVRQVMNEMTDHNRAQNVDPYLKEASGLYNLNKFNDVYWNRFNNSLKAAQDRGVIVSMEVWGTFWYFCHNPDYVQGCRWDDVNPFNPNNNVNYNSTESKLPTSWRNPEGATSGSSTAPGHPVRSAHLHPFFKTVPALDNNEFVIEYQKSWIDKILSYSLNYDNVIYVMNNETSVDWRWGAHWANYIKEKAGQKNKTVYVTDMYDPTNIKDSKYDRLYNNPNIFNFIEISQNNHNGNLGRWPRTSGDVHWDNVQYAREKIKNNPRPINNVKIYGSQSYHNEEIIAGERFWRNILGGAASSRFHRPTAGLGNTSIGLTHLKSARMFVNEYDIFTGSPCNDRLSNRSSNEAFANCSTGSHYAVYFPSGNGSVRLSVASGSYTLKWLNIGSSRWQNESTISGGNVTLSPPGSSSHWVAVIKKSVVAIPTIPNLSSSSNNANNISTSPTLVWNSVEGAKTYHLQVSTNSNFSSFIYNQSNITSNSRQLSDLANNQIYYWRVKAINDAGEGSWSNVWSFKTLVPAVSGKNLGTKTTKLFYPYVDFEIDNVSYSGNPFDEIVNVTFTHSSGDTVRSFAFYDGDWNEKTGRSTNNKWVIRFAGVKTGNWSFKTSSSNPNLDNYTGSINVGNQNNNKVKGPLSTVGTAFAYDSLDGGKKFIPYNIFNRNKSTGTNYSSYIYHWLGAGGRGDAADDGNFRRLRKVNENLNGITLDAQINNILKDLDDHGMDAFLMIVFSWFKYEDQPMSGNYQSPDVEVFRVIERILKRLGEHGKFVHFWKWADGQYPATPGLLDGGFNGKEDLRLQRYIAGRLGPLLNWTMAYGFDLRESWVSESQVRQWHQNMSSFMGWRHLLTVREDIGDWVKYVSRNREWSLGNNKLDFFSVGGGPVGPKVAGFKIDGIDDDDFYGIASWWLDKSPNLPLYFAERLVLGRWDFFDETLTRRAMWQFSMAGYANADWGVKWDGEDIRGEGVILGREYNNKNELRIHNEFWHKYGFFYPQRNNNLTSNGYVLSSSSSDSVKKLIFYNENTNSISLDLRNVQSINKAIAVNTRGASYQEVNIANNINAGSRNTWRAPTKSDWVIYRINHY